MPPSIGIISGLENFCEKNWGPFCTDAVQGVCGGGSIAFHLLVGWVLILVAGVGSQH